MIPAKLPWCGPLVDLDNVYFPQYECFLTHSNPHSRFCWISIQFPATNAHNNTVRYSLCTLHLHNMHKCIFLSYRIVSYRLHSLPRSHRVCVVCSSIHSSLCASVGCRRNNENAHDDYHNIQPIPMPRSHRRSSCSYSIRKYLFKIMI